MDQVLLAFFLSTLIGGVVHGFAGFAFGLVVSGFWLHFITPVESASLIIAFTLPAQIYGNWKVRHAFNWRHVLPIISGTAIGSPIGVMILRYIDATPMRLGVGCLLIAYSLYGLMQPALKPLSENKPAEVVLGFFNGLLGGMTGLAGILLTIWCSMRNWTRDQQRAVYQPVLLATIIFNAASLFVSGAASIQTVTLLLVGAPALIIGIAIGMALYNRVNDQTFRRAVLILLLLSGVSLVVPSIVASVG